VYVETMKALCNTSTSLASKASGPVMNPWLTLDTGSGAEVPILGSRNRSRQLAALVVFLPRNSIGTIDVSAA
jgi:hypothetical protein